MSTEDEWSPDQPQGTEVFEPGDEAFDEAERLDPGFLEAAERDPSINPTNQLDSVELDEAGVALDDPEMMVTLDGGTDDPDGLGMPPGTDDAGAPDDQGWDLDGGERLGVADQAEGS